MVNQEMFFFQPCDKDPSRITMDVNTLKKINIQKVFDKVNTMPQKFRYSQFSTDLDMVKFSFGPREIMIFGNGKIKISSCADKQDALFTLGEMEALIKNV